jgi:hypothetical protein
MVVSSLFVTMPPASLGALGSGKYLDLDIAAAGNTEVIRAKMRTMESRERPLSLKALAGGPLLSGPGRHPHGPADQWMAKSARVYPSALTVGWMKLFSIIRVACASAALISGPVTFGLCLTCVNARFCAWP